MIERALGRHLKRLSETYPVVTVTGPRQSGKTTLCKAVFAERDYASLEDPDVRNAAIGDPRGFLARYPEGVVLDEIQRAPDLLSFIQTIVDSRPDDKGLFVLTGSTQFQLLASLSQSLAGRTALVSLLPFSYDELYAGRSDQNLEQVLFSGFYPRIHNEKLDPTEALKFYFATYIERDVRQLLGIRDLTRFEMFLRICAARSGQILNLSSVASDCGINHNTSAAWLSVLEASYLVFRVFSHSRNFNKRLTKAPKLFFHDVGLMCYLLGIENPRQLVTHPLRGAVFETFVAGELIKRRFNNVKDANLFYFRDSHGHEVDFILDYPDRTTALEAKAGLTFAEDWIAPLDYYSGLSAGMNLNRCVVYGGRESFEFRGCRVIAFREVSSIDV